MKPVVSAGGPPKAKGRGTGGPADRPERSGGLNRIPDASP